MVLTQTCSLDTKKAPTALQLIEGTVRNFVLCLDMAPVN